MTPETLDEIKEAQTWRDHHEKWLIGTDDDAETAQEWVMENLTELIGELERLRGERDQAREALKFYADKTVLSIRF